MNSGCLRWQNTSQVTGFVLYFVLKANISVHTLFVVCVQNLKGQLKKLIVLISSIWSSNSEDQQVTNQNPRGMY